MYSVYIYICSVYTYSYCSMYSVTQSCPTLCDPVHSSPPGSSIQGISQQEYWSGLPFPTPGDLPDPGIKPRSLVSPALIARLFTPAPPGKSIYIDIYNNYI